MKLLKLVVFSIPFLFLGSCIVLFSMWMRDASRPPEIGENLQRVEWLPEEAVSTGMKVV